MKIYDCFTFYNEFELLELRLKSLWDVVDYFVIVEADRKHNNVPKPFYFWERQNDFKAFFPKIRHLPVEMNVPYSGAGDWSIENAQRDAIAYGLEDAEPDDLIMISDADEIVAPDVFQRLQENQIKLFAPYVTPATIDDKNMTCPAWLLVSAIEFLDYGAIVMDQKFFCYYFDWVSKSTWQGTILTKRKTLTTPQALRDVRNFLPRVIDGGYHFSYMGGVDRVIDKISSIVEGVVKLQGKTLDRHHVAEVMANGTDIYGRKHIPEAQLLSFNAHNINLPRVDEFLRKYPNFLREPEKFFGG